MKLRLFAVFSILALATGTTRAGLDEGKAAFERANYPTALRELQPFAEQGNAYAQSRLGTMHLGGLGVPHNPDEALKWLRKAADQGDAQAQGWLGFMVVRGVGIARNVAEGLRLIRMAVDQGDPYAPLTLAWAYRHGHGVAKDEAEEHKWLGKAAEAIRKAAEEGDATAQYTLAGAYAKGHGVAINEAEAVTWLRKAIEQGHASAQFSQGIAFATGQSVAGNVAEEVKRLRRATDQSDIAMQILLGVLYAQGNGVAKDEAEALKWYLKAADQGHGDARIRLVALQRRLEAPRSGPQQANPTIRGYNNAIHRWSVSYPSDWKLDTANPADVRLVSPTGEGLCGVHSWESGFATANEFADSIQARKAQHFKDRGVAVRDAPKRQISLRNGASGIDVTTEILSGGRSRRIYVLGDTVGYHIDCETNAANWAKLEPFFSGIIGSFSPERKP